MLHERLICKRNVKLDVLQLSLYRFRLSDWHKLFTPQIPSLITIFAIMIVFKRKYYIKLGMLFCRFSIIC